MSKINIVKKLSGKVLVGNVKSVVKDLQEGQSMDLYQVVGVARGTKTGTSNFGDWTALMGDFVASPLVGAKANQRFRTGQLFLPDVALNLVSSAVEGLARGEGVEVAFTISATADENSSTGYEYNCQFLKEPENSDPVSNLLALLPPEPKAEKPAK